MGQDPRQIRSEIAATRARMDDTVDALEYKTDVPARVNDRIDTVKATIGDVAMSVVERVGDASARVGATFDGVQTSVKNAVSGALSSDTASHSSSPTVREGLSDVQED